MTGSGLDAVVLGYFRCEVLGVAWGAVGHADPGGTKAVDVDLNYAFGPLITRRAADISMGTQDAGFRSDGLALHGPGIAFVDNCDAGVLDSFRHSTGLELLLDLAGRSDSDRVGSSAEIFTWCDL